MKLALMLAAAACLATAAIAADAPSAATPAAAVNAGTSTTAAYRVVVDAPSPLKQKLERNVGLVRWQDYAEMTDELRDRLMREAVEETRNAAATEGFFSPDTKV